MFGKSNMITLLMNSNSHIAESIYFGAGVSLFGVDDECLCFDRYLLAYKTNV